MRCDCWGVGERILIGALVMHRESFGRQESRDRWLSHACSPAIESHCSGAHGPLLESLTPFPAGSNMQQL